MRKIAAILFCFTLSSAKVITKITNGYLPKDAIRSIHNRSLSLLNKDKNDPYIQNLLSPTLTYKNRKNNEVMVWHNVSYNKAFYGQISDLVSTFLQLEFDNSGKVVSQKYGTLDNKYKYFDNGIRPKAYVSILKRITVAPKF